VMFLVGWQKGSIRPFCPLRQ